MSTDKCLHSQVKVGLATVKCYEQRMVAKASASIGRRLYLARSKRGVSMADVADKAAISPSAINLIEKGRRTPNVELVEGLARALEVDPAWLAFGTGTPPDWTKTE